MFLIADFYSIHPKKSAPFSSKGLLLSLSQNLDGKKATLPEYLLCVRHSAVLAMVSQLVQKEFYEIRVEHLPLQISKPNSERLRHFLRLQSYHMEIWDLSPDIPDSKDCSFHHCTYKFKTVSKRCMVGRGRE